MGVSRQDESGLVDRVEGGKVTAKEKFRQEKNDSKDKTVTLTKTGERARLSSLERRATG